MASQPSHVALAQRLLSRSDPELIKNSILKDFVFETDKLIGSGGYGTVIFGTNNVDGTTKALKVMIFNDPVVKSQTRMQKEQKRQIKEAKLFSKLKHDNVLRYFWCWIEDLPGERGEQAFFILMDKCELDLEDLIVSEVQDHDTVLDYSKQMLSGLAYLHGLERQAGDDGEMFTLLIHRDFKPANVLAKKIREGNRVAYILKIADFGMADVSRAIRGDSTLKHRTSVSHLDDFYRAPEVGPLTEPMTPKPDGNKKDVYGEKVDCFALGRIMVLMLLINSTSASEFLLKERNARQSEHKRILESDPIQEIKESTLCQQVAELLTTEDVVKRLSAKDALRKLQDL